MYLTRHGNGYRFQRRIPAELVPILGKSPIRLNLGGVPSRTAAAASFDSFHAFERRWRPQTVEHFGTGRIDAQGWTYRPGLGRR